ncbi:MAG: lipopolysaccharide heptosyltransferase II [Candidatus Omnitrophota bacterium]
MKKKNTLKNIVILRTDRIGEVLLSTVAVSALKKKYPDLRVSFVTSVYSSPLLEGRTDIARVIETDTLGGGSVLLKAIKLSFILRKGRFDSALIMNPHKMLHLACYLAGIPERAGYDRKWGFLLTSKIADKRDEGLKHEIEYAYDLLKLLGVEEKAEGPILSVSEKEERSLTDKLAKKGISEKEPFAVIFPGSSNPSKRWPENRFTELIQRMEKELGLRAVVSGGSGEEDLVRDIAREADGNTVSFSYELDLREIAVLLKRSRVFIGNDTGPMHMAAALKTPVIAIFGRNIPGVGPVRWRPWGEGHIVFHEDAGCGVCRDAECPEGYKCMDAVTVEAVFGAAKKILGEG